MLRPNGVVVAGDGSIFVMDRGNYRIVHLSADGRFLDAFGRFGTAPDEIHSGWDLALGPEGNLYFGNLTYSESSELIHDGIKVFSPQGHFLGEVGAHDYAPEDDSYRPYGLGVDEEGRVYVADFVPNTVRIFSPRGELLGTFFGETGTGDGEFNGLNDVAVDDSRGLVYVVDNVNSRIQQFEFAESPGGITLTHRLTFGGYGEGPGEFAYPQYAVVDEESGRLYVSDLANERIQAFDPDGRYLLDFAPAEVDIWQAMGVAVGEDGAVYVADAFNNAIWVFEPDGQVRSRFEVLP